MSEQRVGTCSLCGGNVYGTQGAYWSILPPPPDHCVDCGAVAAGQSDVIPMVPAPRPRRYVRTIVSNSVASGEIQFWQGNRCVARITNVK